MGWYIKANNWSSLQTAILVARGLLVLSSIADWGSAGKAWRCLPTQTGWGRVSRVDAYTTVVSFFSQGAASLWLRGPNSYHPWEFALVSFNFLFPENRKFLPPGQPQEMHFSLCHNSWSMGPLCGTFPQEAKMQNTVSGSVHGCWQGWVSLTLCPIHFLSPTIIEAKMQE